MAIVKAQFTMRLDVKSHCKLQKIAAIENRSLTNMIDCLVKKCIAEYEIQNGEIILSDEDLAIQ